MADDIQDQPEAAAPPQVTSLVSVPRRGPPTPIEAPSSIEPFMSAAPPQSGKKTSLWDVAGNAAWNDTVAMGSEALAAASFAARKLTGDPQLVGWLENQRHATDDYITHRIANMPADEQKAFHASLFGGDVAGGEHIPTPGEVGWDKYIAASLGSLVPTIATAILPGGIAAKLAVKLGAVAAKGIGRTAISLGTTGITFGALQGGAAYKTLVDTLDQASDKEMMENPAYAQLRQSGMDEVGAKKALASQAAPFVAGQFGIGAVTGASAGIVTRGALGAAGHGLARRMALGAGEGAVTMGAQAGGQNILEQKANQALGPQKQFEPERMYQAFASGTLNGALLGAVTGVIPHKKQPLEGAPPPSSSQVAPDAGAALNEALPTTPPPSPSTPAQGELPLQQPGVPQTTPPPTPPPPPPPPPPSPPAPAPAASNAQRLPTTQNTARPSAGMKKQELADALATMPGYDPKALKVMGLKDLAIRYDREMAKQQTSTQTEQTAPISPTVGQAQPPTAEGAPGGEPAPPLSEWITANRNASAELAYKLGLTDTIRQLANAGKTAKEISGALGGKLDADEVRAVRDSLGIAPAGPMGFLGATFPESGPRAPETTEGPAPAHEVDKAAAKAVEPTPGQAEAGNYEKGHVRIHGLDVSIETPKGGMRRGPLDEKTGNPQWETVVPAHYGYVRGTKGADGDHVDVALGGRTKAIFDGTPEQAAREPVFVIDQVDPATKKFDEHKALIGYHTTLEAQDAYDKMFSDGSGPQRRGAVNEMTFDKFKDWLKGDTTKAISYTRPRTVGEQLVSKRAQAKAAMAKPGAPQQGSVATAEAPVESAPSVPVREARTHAEAMQDMRDAADYAARTVVPLAKGDTPKIMGRVMQELSDFLGKTSQDEGGIVEGIARWGNSKPTPILGSKTRRADIANEMLKVMTGKSLDEVSGKTRGYKPGEIGQAQKEDISKRAGEAKARVGDNDTKKPVETVAAKAGDTTQEFGAERAPPVNKKYILSNLERDVANGLKTATEADRIYGRKEGVGRDRTHPDFASYIKKRLELVENPSTERALIDEAKRVEADKELTADTRKAKLREITKQLDQASPEYAGKLRAMLHELEDPVGAAADREARRGAALEGIQQAREQLRAHGAPAPRGWDKAGDEITDSARRLGLEAKRVIDIITDPKVNASVDNLLKKGPSTLHAHLDTIIADSAIRARLPGLLELAQRLRALTHDIPVVPETYRKVDSGFTMETAGVYLLGRAGKERIALRPDSKSHMTTLLHEAIHAATARYIEHLAPDSRDAQFLRAVAAELENIDAAPTSQAQIGYASSNLHEVVTMMLTNPTVQTFARNHQPSPKFTAEMARLGVIEPPRRSLWQSFVGLVRRVLGLKTTPPSLLDTVMRPLHDVIERGAAHNRSVLPADPELRGAAAPLADTLSHALPEFNKTLRDVVDRVDPGGLSDKNRRLWLGAERLDGLVKWYEKLFDHEGENGLRATRAASERIEKAKKDYSDANLDKVNAIVRSYKGKDRDELARLFIDATLAEANPAPGATNNDHLTKPDQKAELGKLQARFNKLSDPAKAAFTSTTNWLWKDMLDRRAAELRNVVRRFLPDATDAQTKELTKALKTEASTKAFLKDPDASDTARMFAGKWDGSRKLVKAIAKLHDQGWVRGTYFPLRRFGDYVLTYGTDDKHGYATEMFVRKSQAEARREELIRQGAEGVSDVQDKRASRLQKVLPSGMLEEINDAIKSDPKLSPHADSLRELASSVMLQHLTSSERMRDNLRRKGIKGASDNIEQIMAQHVIFSAARRGYLEAGLDREQALEQMRRRVRWLGDNGKAGEQIKASAVLHEVEKRYPSGDETGDALTDMFRKATSFGYTYSLASLSHWLTSTWEAHTNSLPILGARHGAFGASVALTRALRDITPATGKLGASSMVRSVTQGLKATDWNVSHTIRDRLIKRGANKEQMTYLDNLLSNAGLIDHSFAREMQRIAAPSGFGNSKAATMWQRFMDLNGVGQHVLDATNKWAIAKAAFDLELKKNKGDFRAAANYAVDKVRESMPNYNITNKNRLSTGKGVLGRLAAPIMQFKQYGMHEYSVLAGLVHQWTASAKNSDERREARNAFVGIVAMHALTAGVVTTVADPLRYILGAYDMITSKTGKPHDFQADARNVLNDIFGPQLGEIIARGAPHAWGQDIHHRVGLGNMLEIPEIKSYDLAGMLEMVGTAFIGAAGSDSAAIADGVLKLAHGDVTTGLKELIPVRFARDMMKAGLLATQGVKTQAGRQILAPEKLSNADIAEQAIGFQPSRVTEAREGSNAVLQAREELKAEHAQILKAFVQADPADRRSVLAQVREFNAANPDARITYSQLVQALQRQKKLARQPAGAFGLTLPRRSAARLEEAGRFANTQ